MPTLQPPQAMTGTHQSTTGPPPAVVTITYRSWDFDARRAGRRIAIKHAEALRKLAD